MGEMLPALVINGPDSRIIAVTLLHVTIDVVALADWISEPLMLSVTVVDATSIKVLLVVALVIVPVMLIVPVNPFRTLKGTKGLPELVMLPLMLIAPLPELKSKHLNEPDALMFPFNVRTPKKAPLKVLLEFPVVMLPFIVRFPAPLMLIVIAEPVVVMLLVI